jgi:hypothetical protein
MEIAGPDEGCPEAFEVCLDLENAGKLVRHLAAQKRWAEQAWEACKEEKNNENPD